ncbi:hypothetical protein D0C36_21025 [Mucilaginibacter conchicola]|uniref:Uncharacterized protein n=1 Tax=Mucilaginibacter conchicola TaxID=2303333 RepID=A0A372NPU9_9SPHI|nr:hypothetical protein [Mucilaginibacter conchicola]RFZ90283.1 hypothetical protein D0C36_21025 [Mucilaginibacter conchicola]
MHVNSKEYQEHSIFEQLEKYSSFYDSFSISIMSFMTLGTKAVLNIDTRVYASMAGSLDSIRLLLQLGRINDAFALQRKFYDSLLMNVYVNLYLDDHHSLKNFIVEKIQNWLQGTEQLPDSRTMINYIKNSPRTSELYLMLHKDKRYIHIRDRANDNTHYNFFRNVMLNDNKVYNEKRIEYLNAMQSDINQLVLMHLSYIFLLNPHYMVSSEQMDCFDLGLEPPENAQYLVANFIQQIFDELVKKYRPDIAEYIKKNSCMLLD